MSKTTEKYPLWCVDTERDTEDRYIGPFTTESEAVVLLRDLPAPCTLRRCRRLKVSELHHAAALDLDLVLDNLNDAEPGMQAVGAWADWDESVVEAKPSAEAALIGWADKHLETKIFICEGDE